MRIDIITLFPSMFDGPFATSMLKKAQDNKLAEIHIHDLREYGLGPRRTVDDVPYGGGAGMVLKPEPVVAAVEAIKKLNPKAKVILLTPSGKLYSQKVADELSRKNGLILIAGHYEGFDERILSAVDLELSVGDYVLTGGEIPAMTLVDSIVRLIPGVLGDENSSVEESFRGGLLEYPHYTRPEEFQGESVPEVLKSGHHGEIAKWRKEKALEKTRRNRPDLIKD